MILPFKEYFDKEKTKPTYFREKILAGIKETQELLNKGQFTPSELVHFKTFKSKLHTIRAGHRWKEGMKMHMAYGVRTKNYQQFNKYIPELEVCKGVQDIRIKYYGLKKKNSVHISIDGHIFYWGNVFGSEIDPSGSDAMKTLYANNIEKLAINDGFDSVEDFFAWFNKDFEGQIIHFTNLKY